VFSLGVAKQRIEVVPCPQAVDAKVVGGSPGLTHGLNGRGLWLDLYANFHVLNLVWARAESVAQCL
jgi:hypothetical protein